MISAASSDPSARMLRSLVSSGEPIDGDIAYQKAILAAMADTWKHAQGTRKHTSQSSILVDVSDKLIKTPTNLRGIVDSIHVSAVEKCKEGTLEAWSLWRFYLAALGERLKAGDYQVGSPTGLWKRGTSYMRGTITGPDAGGRPRHGCTPEIGPVDTQRVHSRS